jgi:cobalt-precorrin-5B (C1)-methyltransferase
VVFVGMIGKLTKLAAGVLMTHYTRSAVSTELLAALTAEVGGDADLVARVRAANTARHAYELWESAGTLGPCGRELCRRVAAVLERFTEGQVAARVVLVDFTGKRVIAGPEGAGSGRAGSEGAGSEGAGSEGQGP